MNNEIVRKTMVLYKVKNYELADIIGIHPNKIQKKLSKELSESEKKQIVNGIKKVFKDRYKRK